MLFSQENFGFIFPLWITQYYLHFGSLVFLPTTSPNYYSSKKKINSFCCKLWVWLSSMCVSSAKLQKRMMKEPFIWYSNNQIYQKPVHWLHYKYINQKAGAELPRGDNSWGPSWKPVFLCARYNTWIIVISCGQLLSHLEKTLYLP